MDELTWFVLSLMAFTAGYAITGWTLKGIYYTCKARQHGIKRQVFDLGEGGSEVEAHCDTPWCQFTGYIPVKAVQQGVLAQIPCPVCHKLLFTEQEQRVIGAIVGKMEWANKWLSWVPVLSKYHFPNDPHATSSIVYWNDKANTYSFKTVKQETESEQ